MTAVSHASRHERLCGRAGLPRASWAICKLLTQESLTAGVKVLNTAVKKAGRPDLRDTAEHSSQDVAPWGTEPQARAARSPRARHTRHATDLSGFPGSCSCTRQQLAARISSSFRTMSRCRADVQSWAADWFRFYREAQVLGGGHRPRG